MKIPDLRRTFHIPMPRRAFRGWLRALRSGQYRKGTKFLVDGRYEQFCCLGVLASEQGCTWNENLKPVPKGSTRAQRSRYYLGHNLSLGLSNGIQRKLARFNDEDNGKAHSHAEIADWIETNLIPS